jgi:hypothetical protein
MIHVFNLLYPSSTLPSVSSSSLSVSPVARRLNVVAGVYTMLAVREDPEHAQHEPVRAHREAPKAHQQLGVA